MEIKKIGNVTIYGVNINKLRVVEVTYENGDVVPTNMAANCTDEAIRNYFKIGREFNLGTEEDNIQKVKSVKILN